MPRSSFILFLAGVASLFAAVGTVSDGLNIEDSTPERWIRTALVTALFAVLWAWLGTLRRKRALILLAIGQTLTLWLIARYAPVHHRTLTATEWQRGSLDHN